MKQRIYFLWFCLFSFVAGQGAHFTTPDNPVYIIKSGDQLAPDSLIQIEDLHWSEIIAGADSNFVNLGSTAKFIFSMDMNQLQTGDYTASIDLDIVTKDANQVSTSHSITLYIDHKATKGTTFKAKSYVSLANVYYLEATVQEIRIDGNPVSVGNIPDYLQLEARIEVDRIFEFKRDDIPALSTIAVDTTNGYGKLNLSWSLLEGAESYELEWTYSDDYTTKLDSQKAVNDVYYDFKRYAGRVRITDNTYSVPAVFDRGYVVFRVRGIGRDTLNLRQDQLGAWSLQDSASIQDLINLGGNKPYVYLNIPHQQKMNWQYAVSFAEEGKRKDINTYYDGLLYNRQLVTRISSENRAIVQENIYDAQGRPAISVLPTPLQDSNLRYYFNQNLNQQSTIYNWRDFDLDTDTSNCLVSSPAMSNSAGANQYYSSNNPDKDRMQAYVPEANGFAFSQVEYTPDNTGRIRRQGGVGEEHQLGSGHETRIFYNDVSQEELNLIFGTEAGYAERYKKIATVDPNGQVGIQFLLGKSAVATALAGSPPPNLDSLPGDVVNPVDMPEDLGKSNRYEPDSLGFVLKKQLFVPTQGDYYFTYNMLGALFEDSCLISGVCFDCVYDFRFSILDDCGNEMISNGPIDTTISPIADLDSLCGSAANYAFDSISISLSLGAYTIHKSLTVNLYSVNYYLEQYLDTALNTCIIPLDSFIQAYTDSIDFSACEDDYCTLDCQETVGNWEEFYATDTTRTLAEYEALILACREECENADYCGGLYDLMKADMSPGGQYATYTINLNTGIYSSSDPYSILNTGNSLASLLYSNLTGPFHFNNSSLEFIDADGNTVLGSNLSLTEFIEGFQENWADSLVKYHPDYCQYLWCKSTIPSQVFDEEILSSSSIEEAIDSGYVDNQTGLPNIYALDPYFQNGPGTSDSTAFQNSLNAYIQNGSSSYSIWELVLIQMHCPELQGGTSAQWDSCLLAVDILSNNCDEDIEWQTYAALYVAKKLEFMEAQRANLICADKTPPGKEEIHPSLEELFGYDPTALPSDSLLAIATGGIADHCQLTCESYATYWYSEIGHCLSTADSIFVIDQFIEICQLGCGIDNPLGTRTTPPGESTSQGFTNFEEVLNSIGIISNPLDSAFNDTCNVWLINMPPLYGESISGATETFAKLDTCACDVIFQIKSEFDTLSYITLSSPSQWFTYTYGFPLINYKGKLWDCQKALEEDYGSGVSWTAGIAWGTQSATYLDSLDRHIDASIGCQSCATCSEISYFFNTYPGLDTLPGGRQMLANIINDSLRFSLGYVDYSNFLDSCIAANDTSACGTDTYAIDLAALLSALNDRGDIFNPNVDLSSYPEYLNSSLNTEGCSSGFFYEPEVFFSRSFNADILHIDTTTAGGLIYAAKHSSNKLLLALQGQDQNWVWNEVFEWPNHLFIWESVRIEQTTDGNYLVSGIIENTSNSEKDLAILKIDSQGGFLWNKVYEHAQFPQRMLGTVEHADGSIMLAYADGGTANSWHYSTIVIKTDASGALLWKKQYEDLGDNVYASNASIPNFKHLTAADNGGVYLGGMSDEFDALGVLKISTGGTEEWAKLIFDYPLYCTINTFSMEQTVDMGLAVMVRGEEDSILSRSSFFKLNPEGTLLWQRDHFWNKAQQGFEPTGMSRTRDGGLLIPGIFTGSPISATNPLGLLKLDSIGHYDWQQAIDGNQTANAEAYAFERKSGQILALKDLRELSTFWMNGNILSGVCHAAIVASINYSQGLTDTIFSPIVDTSFSLTVSPLTPSSFTDSLVFTATCGERLQISFGNGCSDTCKVELSLGNLYFDQIDSFTFRNIVSDSTFFLDAHYGGNSQSISVKSSCTASCQGSGLTLCNEALFPLIEVDSNDCRTYLIALAEHHAAMAYTAYIDTLSAGFERRYIEKCLDTTVLGENFRVDYQHQLYHYTLYYYDQAGNLLQSVPPAGVKYLESTQFTQVDQLRKTNSSTALVPLHEKATQYRYNSLNQLVWQSTPDGGESTFLYDPLGRLIISRNAKQADVSIFEPYPEYSYTLYDPIGRVKESGEVRAFSSLTAAAIESDTAFENWVNINPRIEYVQTTYDFPVNDTVNDLFSGGQQNLRGRVSAVNYTKPGDPYADNSMYYSYDIHGNVKTMICDIPHLEHLDQQYKRIQYDYDLISGNVHQVRYQAGESDQFFHRYYYDADNRITEVETSRDSCIWDREARYHYYQHGPLARTEIGQEQVQAQDYVYTLQGWIKNVNSDTKTHTRDPGKDGYDGSGTFPYDANNVDIHKNFGRDAYGYSLGYFQDDYVAISALANDTTTRSQANTDIIYASIPNSSLWNGNIRSMVTALSDTAGAAQVQGTVYKYDQLNRITTMNAYKDPNLVASNKWQTPTDNKDYESSYSYDGDGNLQTLSRNGNLASGNQEMDQLDYHYYTRSVNGRTETINRLAWVDDSISDSNYAVDIDDQDSVNYKYDKIGNLIYDAQEKIAEIVWDVSGKIREIKRDISSNKPDLAFHYDPGGNRITKIVKPTPNEESWKYTYYVRDASGNVMATYSRSYQAASYFSGDSLGGYSALPTGKTFGEIFQSIEHGIYGSARLGLDTDTRTQHVLAYDSLSFDTDGYVIIQDTLTHSPDSSSSDGSIFTRGLKLYELSNHLGNVLATLSDRKLQIENAGNIDYFTADIRSVKDYYGFGMEMPGRGFEGSGYRFGFQGQETDQELYEGAISYKYRIHDPRIGKFLSIDPLAPKYPHNSPYAFSENRVIDGVELEGLEHTLTPDKREIFSAGSISIFGVGEDYYYSKNNGPLTRIPTIYDLLDILSYTDVDDLVVKAGGTQETPGVGIQIGNRKIGGGYHLDGSPVSTGDVAAIAAGDGVPLISGKALAVLSTGAMAGVMGVFKWLSKHDDQIKILQNTLKKVPITGEQHLVYFRIYEGKPKVGQTSFKGNVFDAYSAGRYGKETVETSLKNLRGYIIAPNKDIAMGIENLLVKEFGGPKGTWQNKQYNFNKHEYDNDLDFRKLKDEQMNRAAQFLNETVPGWRIVYNPKNID